MPPVVRESQKMAEYQVNTTNSGNGAELTGDSYPQPRSASPTSALITLVTSLPSDDGRGVVAGRRGPWWWEGRSACRHHSYSVETPRQLLHAAGERSEAYLDVVLGVLTGNARASMSTAARRLRWLGSRSVVVAHADGNGLTAPHVAVSNGHVCRRGRGVRYRVSR